MSSAESSVMRAIRQGALGMATCLLLPDVALAQSLKAAFQGQQDDRLRVQAICEAQYKNAQFYPLEDSKKYRYMVSDRGIQAISPQVVQQSSGVYMCDRGGIEAPMRVGSEYKSDFPICLIHECLLSPLPMPVKGASGYRVTRVLEIDQCLSSALFGEKCLFLYESINGGAVTRHVLAWRAIVPGGK